MNNTVASSIFQRTAIGVAVLAASMATATHSYAQLEEVIVTAQKRAQSANDVGITINSFTGDQIRDMGVSTAEDIAMFTPGLTVNETAATGVPLYTIRGVGFQDYSTAASSTVGIYFDEVNMPYTVMTRGLVFDTARVEVLKGPQGDLYGRNTTAGQINFISNKPSQEFEAGVIASYGNYDAYEIEGFVSGGNDFAQGRLAFKTTQSDEGWQKSTTRNDELGEKDATALRGIGNFNFTDTLQLQVIAHYIKDESENRANTSYNDFEREEANDWDGGFFNDSSNINTTDLTVFSQEIRLSGEVGDVNWIGGLYYSDDDMDEYYHYFMSDSVFGNGSIPWGVDLFAPTPILELDTKYSQETESWAVFGHVEWQFSEAWRLTLGARYTEEERDWEGCTFVADDGSLGGFLNAQFGSTLAPGDCGTIDDDPNSPTYIFGLLGTPNVNDAFHVYKDSLDTEKWMGKIGLDYIFSDDVLVYGTLSRGFKSGGFNGANSNTTQQLVPYEEEELTSYEIGTKATLLDGTMQFNAAAFFYEYDDKQEQDASVTFVGNISGLTNVPESEIYGAELDMHWLPTEGLTFNLGVAWLDTEIKEWDAVDRDASDWPVTVTRDVSGAELSQSPEWQYTGLVKYEWSVGSNLTMEIAGDLSYTDDTTGGINAEEATEDYTIIGARLAIGAADGQWRAMLWGRNLADEDYFPSAYVGGNGPFVRSQGMPRTYGVTLSYFFGQ